MINDIIKMSLMDSDEEFLVEIMNNYLKYYKMTHNLDKELTLFDGMNEYDKTITNNQLESFYKELKNYKKNDNKIEKYNPESKTKYLFGITKNTELSLVSNSLFALLIELTNLERENKTIKYELINLYSSK